MKTFEEAFSTIHNNRERFCDSALEMQAETMDNDELREAVALSLQAIHRIPSFDNLTAQLYFMFQLGLFTGMEMEKAEPDKIISR